jgi:carbonic anhydrase
MDQLKELFENNRAWAAARLAENPDVFTEQLEGQQPQYLWIGCSDSRVPANEIIGLTAGEVFVHRNVANVVEPSDINCLSVLQFGVDVLKVRHVIVCGHYECGGVKAAMGSEPLGLIDAWLARIREAVRLHHDALAELGPHDRFRRLCEINVLEQAVAACYTPSVQAAWRAGQELTVHGVIYDLADGHLKDLGFSVSAPGEIQLVYGAASGALR